MSSATLSHRGVIRISGEDRANFLQGLITQDVTKLQPGVMLYGCLLTPQGKYLADFFMIERDEAISFDIDLSLLNDTIKRLSMFKLRSRVVIEDVSMQFDSVVFWNEESSGFSDPRAPDIGRRDLVPRGEVKTRDDDYTLWQLQNGLPDIHDFHRERDSMLEANMDLLNALSWDKGCYMGQELTARTHYRGLVKKRFLPVRFTHDVNIATDTPVEKNGKTIGHTRSQHQNYALAQLQLDGLQADDVVTIAGQQASVIFPAWFIQP